METHLYSSETPTPKSYNLVIIFTQILKKYIELRIHLNWLIDWLHEYHETEQFKAYKYKIGHQQTSALKFHELQKDSFKKPLTRSFSIV